MSLEYLQQFGGIRALMTWNIHLKQCQLSEPAPSGPIYDYKDFRQRYPDGRMGSDPFLAKESHGEIFLDKASKALSEDLLDFLK